MEFAYLVGIIFHAVVSYASLKGMTQQKLQPDPSAGQTLNENLDSHNRNSINNIGGFYGSDYKTEFLGCGYDMFKSAGNDKDATYLDNFKSPLLDSYLFGEMKPGDTAGRFDKLNMWILPIFNCRVYAESKSINSAKDYKMELKEVFRKDRQKFASVDIEVDDNYTKWDEVAQRLRFTKIQDIQCTIYTAGISDVNDTTNMKDMHDTMQANIRKCGNGFQDKGCPVNAYLQSPYSENCLHCVAGWMNFLRDYGTHFTSKVTMGGTMKRLIYTNDALYNKEYKQQSINVTQTVYMGSIKGVEHRKVYSEGDVHGDKPESYEEYDTSFGPSMSPGSITSDAIKKWIDDVVQKPVPIDVEYTAIRDILKTDQERKMFDAAVLYYGMTLGDRAREKYNMGYSNNELFKLIQASEQVVINGVEERNKLCGGSKKVLWGFGVTFNKDGRILQVKYCIRGLNNCLLENGREVKSSFVWVLCHNVVVLKSKQIMVRGRIGAKYKTVAQCPQFMTIAAGVAMRFAANHKETIESCKPGTSKCSYFGLGDNGFIYIICVPARTFGVKQLRSYSTAKVQGPIVSCGALGYKITKGLDITTIKRDDNVNIKAEMCPKYSSSCGKVCGDCVSSLSWIICIK